MRSSIRTALAALVAAAWIAGCSGDDSTGPPAPQPQPGELRVSVASGSTVGAVVLSVTGPGLTSATAVPGSGLRAYSGLSETTLKAVVAGVSLSGEVLRFAVPDVLRAEDYEVVVEQASGTANQPLDPAAITASLLR